MSPTCLMSYFLGTYLHHKEIKASQGIKITAQGLEHAIAETGLHVVGADDDIEQIKKTAMEDMESVMSRIDGSGEGVCVQASTFGSLETLLEFLKSPAVDIPVRGISIRPVCKEDVMKASVMLEKKKEYATILAFDVTITPEACEYADEVGVQIFTADIIYHLLEQFKAFIGRYRGGERKVKLLMIVFPCIRRLHGYFILFTFPVPGMGTTPVLHVYSVLCYFFFYFWKKNSFSIFFHYLLIHKCLILVLLEYLNLSSHIVNWKCL